MRIETTLIITVYSKPACPQCSATRRYLDKAHLDYLTVDVTQDPDAAAFVASLGYTAAPVVVAGKDHWAGFRPDRIEALASG
jgi:glutaredoxin-like protein NrdH